MNEEKIYTIQNFSNAIGLTQHTLRYYEKIGIIPPIQRDWSGQRIYTEADLGWVNFIKCLKSTGMSIESLKEFVAIPDEEPDSIEKRKALLETHLTHIKEEIKKYQTFAEHLHFKIKYYREVLAVKNPVREEVY